MPGINNLHPYQLFYSGNDGLATAKKERKGAPAAQRIIT